MLNQFFSIRLPVYIYLFFFSFYMDKDIIHVQLHFFFQWVFFIITPSLVHMCGYSCLYVEEWMELGEEMGPPPPKDN